MICPLAFEFSVYSRFDFVRMICVLHNLIISEIINRYVVPDFSGLAFANEKISLKRYPSALIAMVSRRFCGLKYPIRTKRQNKRYKFSGLLKNRLLSGLKMHVKDQNNRTCFSIIILLNLKKFRWY